MNDSDERVLTAVMIDLYFLSNLIFIWLLPTIFGNFEAMLQDIGYTGIFHGIDCFGIAATIFRCYERLVFLLPVYAILQAAPKGAFSLKE